jgi:hypothetical protein
MPFVTVRHYTEADIPARIGLLREPRFTANLIDFAVLNDDGTLEARQRRTINELHDSMRIFTLCGPKGVVLGYAWITSIDWRSQCCELSFGILPRYRGAFGAAAVAAAHAYIRAELNMRVTINQVLEHNTMLVSAQSLAERRQVRCEYDSYTVGEWRTACYWTETEQDLARDLDRMAERRREIADRIRAETTAQQ